MLWIWLWVVASFALPPAGAGPDVSFDEIVLGASHACGRYADGRVSCWGSNEHGQLGNGSFDPSVFPMPVIDLTDAVTLSAGAFHTCAVKRDRSVVCWGDNHAGQLALTGKEALSKPVRIAAIPPALRVAAGASHTCSVSLDGKVSCWGDNLYHQLGNADVRTTPFPLPVQGLSQVTDLAAGYGHTCALDRDGRVFCWGDDSVGQAGRPPPQSGQPIPVMPLDTDLPPVRALSARDNWTCALHSEGVSCWGAVPGKTGPQPPALVVKQKGLLQLSVGPTHGCALAGNREVTCFGSDATGQLGAVHPVRNVVVGAYGLRDATWVAAGTGESCAARGDHERLVCWGLYTEREREAAAKEDRRIDAPAPPPPKWRPMPGTELDIQLREVLAESGAHIRFDISTIESNPCANAKLDIVTELKRRRLLVKVGQPFLPGGTCIAQAAPIVGSVELPPEASGRYDIIIEWKKKQQDFYQMTITDTKVDILPMQAIATRWVDPLTMWRIPPGSMAITCDRHLDAPICQRRLRDNLPTCDALFAEQIVRDAPVLADKPRGDPMFSRDPNAVRISPDVDWDNYQKLFEQTYEDGSGCVDLRVQTWLGKTWTNQPKVSATP